QAFHEVVPSTIEPPRRSSLLCAAEKYPSWTEWLKKKGRLAPALCSRLLQRNVLRARLFGVVGIGLGAAARALLLVLFDQLHGFGQGQLVARTDLAAHPVHGLLEQLALGIGLLRLVVRPVKVAHDFRNRDQVA